MADRILKTRSLFHQKLKANNTPGDWSHIMSQTGMFTFTGLKRKLYLFSNLILFFNEDRPLLYPFILLTLGTPDVCWWPTYTLRLDIVEYCWIHFRYLLGISSTHWIQLEQISVNIICIYLLETNLCIFLCVTVYYLWIYW